MGAILHTAYLPHRLTTNLADGLWARYNELVSMQGAGYAEDNTAQQRADLIDDARNAFALGLLSYLPPWAKLP